MHSAGGSLPPLSLSLSYSFFFHSHREYPLTNNVYTHFCVIFFGLYAECILFVWPIGVINFRLHHIFFSLLLLNHLHISLWITVYCMYNIDVSAYVQHFQSHPNQTRTDDVYSQCKLNAMHKWKLDWMHLQNAFDGTVQWVKSAKKKWTLANILTKIKRGIDVVLPGGV